MTNDIARVVKIRGNEDFGSSRSARRSGSNVSLARKSSDRLLSRQGRRKNAGGQAPQAPQAPKGNDGDEQPGVDGALDVAGPSDNKNLILATAQAEPKAGISEMLLRHREGCAAAARSNAVYTTRYTAWNFVWVNLWEQLYTITNGYFLFIIVLQCIKPITITRGMPTILVPLSAVLIVNGVKDALEDCKRKRSDNVENNLAVPIVKMKIMTAADLTRSIIAGGGTTATAAAAGVTTDAPPGVTGSASKSANKLRARRSLIAPYGELVPSCRLIRAPHTVIVGPVNPVVSAAMDCENHSLGTSPKDAPPPPPGQTGPDQAALPVVKCVITPSGKAATLLLKPTTASTSRRPTAAKEKRANEGLLRDNAMQGPDSDSEVEDHILPEWVDFGSTPPPPEEEEEDEEGGGEVKFNNVVDRLATTRWQNLQVGDLVVVGAGQQAPADGVLLATADTRGTVFIETSSLDGETTLKMKSPVSLINKLVTHPADEEATFLATAALSLSIEVSDHPSPALTEFRARVIVGRGVCEPGLWASVADAEAEICEATATHDNLLPRGCRVCHTSWCVMLVVYVGAETKIRLNSSEPRKKISQLERRTQQLVLATFCCMLCLCAIASGLRTWTQSSVRFRSLYRYTGLMVDSHGGFWTCVTSYFTWMLLFANLVPISLVVSMGLTRALQARYMQADASMENERGDGCVVRTSDLNEELGQIKYIMTDKSGTLTANVMKFRKCVLGTTVFGDLPPAPSIEEERRATGRLSNVRFRADHGGNNAGGESHSPLTPANRSPASASASPPPPVPTMRRRYRVGSRQNSGIESSVFLRRSLSRNALLRTMPSNTYATSRAPSRHSMPNVCVPAVPHFNCNSPALESTLRGEMGAAARRNAILFFVHLVVNHSALVDETDSRVFIASSPDEEALLYGAFGFDVRFSGRTADGSFFTINGRRHFVFVDHFYPFDSDRKRSAIVVSFDPSVFEPTESSHPATDDSPPAASVPNRAPMVDERAPSPASGGAPNPIAGGAPNPIAGGLSNPEGSGATPASPLIMLRSASSSQGLTQIPLVAPKPPDRPLRYVFIKGADSAVLPLCQSFPPEVDELINRFACECLRTLVLACRQLSEDEYAAWLARVDEAKRNGDPEKLMDTGKWLEQLPRGLDYQGFTGIEDILSEGVPDTIEALLKAGIRIWMITGDKFETAFNVGLATRLFHKDSLHITLTASKVGSISDEALEHLLAGLAALLKSPEKLESECRSGETSSEPQELRSLIGRRASSQCVYQPPTAGEEPTGNSARSPPRSPLTTPAPERKQDMSPSARGGEGATPDCAIVWDGTTFRRCMDNPALRGFVYDLSSRCRAVIFCRTSPQEKGDVVRLVKEIEPTASCLAVGDGANDCNMLAAADVGVGLKGREGLQAYNSGDYGITEFRHLKTLMLVHGRWCQRRMSKMVMHTFYKNFVFSMPTCYLGFFSLFSGQRVFPDLAYQMYNVALTQLPVMAFGIWDQDVNRELSLQFPQLYKAAVLNGSNKGHRSALLWLLSGVWHSVCIFFITVVALCPTTWWRQLDADASWTWLTSGVQEVVVTDTSTFIPNDYYSLATIMLLEVLVIVSAKLLIETMCPNWITFVSIGMSFMFITLMHYSSSFWPQLFPTELGNQARVLSMPMTYLVIAITSGVALSLDVIIAVFERTFRPELHHLMQFLMRFEQEERRAHRILMLEAVRQGGPQLLQALGGNPESHRRTRMTIGRGSGLHSSVVLDSAPDGVQNKKQQVEVAGTIHEDEIDEALQQHRRELNRVGNTTDVVLEVLSLKSLVHTIRGGFAYNDPVSHSDVVAFGTGKTAIPL